MQRDPNDVDSGATTRFTCFPVELHLQILCAMDPEVILALRKTSKYFHALTYEPRLWCSIYHRMRQTHPLDCSQSELAAMTPWQSERLLVRASKTEKVFQTRRERPSHCIIPCGQARKLDPLSALAFLSDRFLLSVDDTTVVYVWDLWKRTASAQGLAFPCTRLMLVGWKYLTHGMTGDHSTLYVVLSRDSRAHVFSLALPSLTNADEPELTFHDVAYFNTVFHPVQSISIDADCSLVLQVRLQSFLDVVDWRTGDQVTIPLYFGEPTIPHFFRNTVNALHRCGPYVLCLREWSIEAYPLPRRFVRADDDPRVGDRLAGSGTSPEEEALPVLRHAAPGMRFTDRTYPSRVRCTRTPAGATYALCVLAEDQRRGTYHYSVCVRTAPPALSVRVLAKDGSHVGRVAASDLGTSGGRGALVLAPDGRGRREVIAFSAPSSSAWDAWCTSGDSEFGADGLDVSPEIAPRFDARLVSVVSSMQSNDDVTKCAVSEFTGRIALGSRTGAITVL